MRYGCLNLFQVLDLNDVLHHRHSKCLCHSEKILERSLSVIFQFKMERSDTDFSFRNHEGLFAIERSADHERRESITT
jgi:hypothetical protein